jgi:hypothetical protein
VARAEVLAWFDGQSSCACLHMDIGVRGEERRRDVNDLMNRRGNLQMGKNLTGDDLVYENPPMLRVILKLDDVKVTVVGFQQMCLRAAPHFANEFEGVYRHAVCRERKSVAEENIT